MTPQESRLTAVDQNPQLAQPPPRDDGDGLGLHEYLGTLLGSRGLIAVVAASALVLGVLYAKLATPIYRSDALLQVEEKKKGIAGLEDIAGMFPKDSAADTEIEILRSRALIEGVVEKLTLDIVARPRRFPLLGAALARGYHGAGFARPFLGLGRYAWGGERIAVDRLTVPQEFENQKLILVAGENGRYVLRDPEGDTWLEGEVGKPSGGGAGPQGAIFISELHARPGTQFVVVKSPPQEVVEKLQRELLISERGRKTGIIRIELAGADVGRIVDALNTLSSLYVRQNVDRRSEEAQKTLDFIDGQLPALKTRLEKAEEALNAYRSTHGTIDLPLETKAAIEKSVQIEKMETELQLQRAELRQKFTDNHPFLAAVNKKLAEVENERAAMSGQIKNLPESELNSVRLLRDVKVNNELYVLLLNKTQELRVVKSGTIGNVRVLDRAFVPRRPVSPLLGQTVGLALALGLALGVLAAFTRRALSRGVEDPDVLEAVTGLSVYASIPHSKSQEKETRDYLKRGIPWRGLLAVREPADLAVESLRSLRTSLQFALMDAKNHIIMLSGPAPGIGKSFVASNLAQVLSDSGKKVLLLDADLRNGSVHGLFGFQREPGLSEVIAGSIAFEKAVHPVSDNLHVLAAGIIPPNPSELLLSQHFRDLLERAGREYDLVVVDTSPILAVTDAAIIARLSGVTLLVLRAGQHPMREITATLKRFAQSGIRPAGLVFNDVTRFANGAYGYGYGYGYQYEYKTKKVYKTKRVS
jgi:tyrosine-protein kinase Etk/Wzc